MGIGGILLEKKCFKVGDKALNITLYDQNKKEFKLSIGIVVSESPETKI